jgi:uncharacterized protein YycO
MGGYHPHHARWQHAAVYIGDYYICESTRWGVKSSTIFPYIGNYLIRVRGDRSLSSDDTWKIAIQALLRLKYKYSYSSIIQLLWQSKYSSWDQPDEPRRFSRRAVICSQLYADAYGSVTGKTLDNNVNLPITPAGLSCTSLLQDIKIHWLKIV